MIHLLAFSAILASVTPKAAEDSSFLGIFAETHLTQIAGMKMKAMPKLPDGISLPANVRAMLPTGPKRMLTVRLYTPVIAPDDATATLGVPAGLKLGDKLNLDLYRPKPPKTGGGGESGPGKPGEDKPIDFTIKFYWGSSETIPDGQPKVISFAGLDTAQKMEMASQMSKVMQKGGDNYYFHDNWTTAYWPTPEQPGEIDKDASLSGTFTLNTTYAGGVTIDAPDGVDFLPAFEMTSPDLSQKPSLAGSLPFQWNPITNAIGLYAMALGMEGQNTLIIWSSSETFANELMMDTGFLQMADVKSRVASHLFMPGTQTSVTVPAGIFANCKGAFLSMIGYGPGSAREGVNPIPRIQTKTTLQLMLSGKKSN